MTSAQSSDQGGRKEPEKEGWPLWGIVLMGTLLSFTVGYFLAAYLARLVAGRGSWWKLWTVQLSSSEWYDVLRSDIAAVGLAAAGGAAFLAYRRQRPSEAQQRTADDQHRLERQRHDLTERVDFRDRYAKAAEQLGHDKPAVRLAGVYAMAQLADDWGRIKDREQQQVCIDVLCAYFRMPPDLMRPDPGEEQVRLTLISVIRQHLQDQDAPTSWCRANLDFTNATFTGKRSFDDATFSGGEVSFRGARLIGGGVYFRGAKFSGGIVSFYDAKFADGEVSFHGAEFCGGKVGFSGVEFGGGKVSFREATFSGGEVSFGSAAFCGGDVSFDEATFSGGRVTFGRAEFSGGTVSFDEAAFSGGRVTFAGAKFSGGAVNFEGVSDWSHPPAGLPDSPRPGLRPPPMPQATEKRRRPQP